jgi:anti-anti-sigma factor
MDEAMLSAVSAGRHNMVVDMFRVEYISSAGLRALASVMVRCKAEGGDMKLAALNKRVTRVFNIIGFDLLMSIHDTPEAAAAEFSASAAS